MVDLDHHIVAASVSLPYQILRISLQQHDSGAEIPTQDDELFNKLQFELLYKLDQNLIDREEAQFEAERFWVGALKDAVVDGDVGKGTLMAGQSVGLVGEIKPLEEIVDEMISDAEQEMQRLSRIFTGAG